MRVAWPVPISITRSGANMCLAAARTASRAARQTTSTSAEKSSSVMNVSFPPGAAWK